MATLRLLSTGAASPTPGNEILSCAFTPDGRLALSGGWDGNMRLWDVQQGSAISAIKVGAKPVSACAVTNDGKNFVAGTLEGMLSRFDSENHKQLSTFLAHSRPISGIAFHPDGRLATTSWDRNLIFWSADKHEGKTFGGHTDIVAGCCFTPEGKQLLSWSYDASVRHWDAATGKQLGSWAGHQDRVMSGDISADGKLAVTGGRDGSLRLWDLAGGGKTLLTLQLRQEIRMCRFLLDMQTIVTAESDGTLRVLSVPDLKQQSELATGLAIHCGDVSGANTHLALGSGDGKVYFVAIEGLLSVPLGVTIRQDFRQTQTTIQRWLGKSQTIFIFRATCPACRQEFEWPGNNPGTPAACPHCMRQLQVACMIPIIS